MGIPLLVGLEPPLAMNQHLRYLRRTSVTPLRHAPHLTLVANTFPSKDTVMEVVARIAAKHQTFTASATGLCSFADDPILGGHPCVWAVRRAPPLVRLQHELFAALTPLRTSDQEHYFLHQRSLYPSREKENITRYGHPIAPAEWRPHVTAGITTQPLPWTPRPVTWRVTTITIYEYEPATGFHPTQHYALAKTGLAASRDRTKPRSPAAR
jgi:hypothetical protein